MHDNNLATDNSTLSSAHEQAIESAGEFLKVDTGGITGFFERIPLCLKLLTITILATVIVLVFAGWLSVVKIRDALDRYNTRNLVKQFQVAVNLAEAVQKEWGAAVLFIVSPANRNLLVFQERVTDTNEKWTTFKGNMQPDTNSQISHQFTKLNQIRDSTGKQQMDPLVLYHWYANTISIITEFISMRSKEYQDQAVLSSHYVFLELTNVIGQLLSYGTIVFANTDSSLNSSIYITFKGLIVTRDTLEDAWKSLASKSRVTLFYQKVTPISNNTAMITMRNITHGYTNFISSADHEGWNRDMIVVNQVYRETMSVLLEEISNTTYKQLLQSDIYFTVIGIVAVAFIILYAAISYCFSRTIIGPWIRMTKLQELVTYKFVPRGLLHMIGCNNITQVTVGKHNIVQIILLNISIRDYWQQTESLTIENRILYTNRFFDAINPILMSYGGFIDTMEPDKLQVCFKTPGSAITCANKIHRLINSMNMSDFAPLNLIIAIHAASSSYLAIIGDRDRIQGVVISKLQQELGQFSSIAMKFQCKTVISSNILELTKDGIDNAQLIAIIDGESPISLYEISSVMNKTEIVQFSKAVRNVFVDYNYTDALSYFGTIENEAAKYYSKVCLQVLEQFKTQIINVTVEDVLNEPALEELVHQICQKEQFIESLEIYRSIKQFTTAFILPSRDVQRKCVTSILNRIGKVTISDTLKQTLFTQVKEEREWNKNIFEGLKYEIVSSLADTIKKLKTSDEFRRAYIKIKGIKCDLLIERFGEKQ